MIDYSRVKRVRVPEDEDAEGLVDLYPGEEFDFDSKHGDDGGFARNERNTHFIYLPCSSHLSSRAWEILNPDTGEWEVAK
ncbi:MAG: hypothetical protein KAT62_02550 [Desulfuromonadales bacterium]|nr:hypothetical protein [Desulfuromonadales bacterium]